MSTNKFRKLLDQIDQILQELGEANLTNLVRKVKKIQKELEEQKLYNAITVELVGGGNIGNAHKILKNRIQERSTEQLPEELRKPPAIWLVGKPKTRHEDGFAPLTPRNAEREHRYNLEAIIDAWASIQALDDEEERRKSSEAFLEYYRTSSADEFSRKIYFFINDLEEPEFVKEKMEDEMEPTYSELMQSIRITEVVDYGVGGVEREK